MKLGDALMTPRPTPSRLYPAIGGGIVTLIALAVFFAAGWPVSGWALGAVLYAGVTALGLFLTRARARMGNLGASGVIGFELMFKAIALLAVLFAVASSKSDVAVAAIVVFALAYTFEFGLSMVTYFGSATR